MANRILASVARYQSRIDGFGGDETGIGMTGQPISALHEDMKLSLIEFVSFQNAQAHAFASGRITQEEATTIYRALGGEVFVDDWPKGTSLAMKLTITSLMGQLLQNRRVPA